MTTGYLAEVFSAIQGEGLFVGERQIFVRLAGCNLRCSYCDTGWAREQGLLYFRAERAPGAREFEEHTNPVDGERAAELVLRLHAPRQLHAAVSFTGGEPLLQADFVAEVARIVRSAGLKVHLETNGTLADALPSVLDAVDVIVMDVKLSSAAGFACWDEHRAFLDAARPFIARQGALLFAKAVFAQSTQEHEIERLCAMIAAAGPGIPLVLQPVSPAPDGPETPSAERALKLQAKAAEFLPDVRVIPQVHKLMGQM